MTDGQMTNGKALLHVENLSVDFQTRGGIVRAVVDVSWSVNPGETLAILGESGSGKSVSAAAVLGLVDTPPGIFRSGRILFHGEDLLAAKRDRRRELNGSRIAMIFQDTLAALNPVYPVGWQIAETFTAHDISRQEAMQRAIELLRRVGISDPERRYFDYPHQFSGGQRQRIMIAMAIALRPEALIADEPTSALDVTVQADILALLKDLQRETGMALVLITHDLGIVTDVADKVIVMNQGSIVERGAVNDVFERPQHAYTRQLLAAVPGRLGFRQQEEAKEEPILSVRDLCKDYWLSAGIFSNSKSVLHAIKAVSFDLRRGETLGVIGESGSGKSSLARTVLGLEQITSGTVSHHGKDLAGMSRKDLQALRRQVQVVFQDPTASLNPRMSVRQIISEAWIVHPGVLSKDKWKSRVEELLIDVGLKPEHADRYPHQFSGGQRQRIAIARALALKPQLIICDEAVSALDVSIQAQIIALLRKLQVEHGLSYLFVAHDLGVVRDFADRVLVMYRGEVVEQGTTEAIFDRPSHPYTQRLLSASTFATQAGLAADMIAAR